MKDGPLTEEYLTAAANNDLKLLVLMQDLVNTLHEELGDSEERWYGAHIVCSLMIPAFADHFGHNLLHHKRQPPRPEVVMSFAYLVGILDAVMRDGPQ